MKSIILLTVILIGQLFSSISLASEPPANYPLVKGIVRKVDLSSNRVSIKHEDIPNLDMPGMTMSFAALDTEMLKGLAVGDKIIFVADEIGGKLTVLWFDKTTP